LTNLISKISSFEETNNFRLKNLIELENQNTIEKHQLPAGIKNFKKDA
jgi:hypothetical protein